MDSRARSRCSNAIASLATAVILGDVSRDRKRRKGPRSSSSAVTSSTQNGGSNCDAISEVASSIRVLPIPASPSSTTAERPADGTAANWSLMTFTSVSLPTTGLSALGRSRSNAAADAERTSLVARSGRPPFSLQRTSNNRHRSGKPLSQKRPRSTIRVSDSEPARSCTIWAMRICPPWAFAATRAAACTAVP